MVKRLIRNYRRPVIVLFELALVLLSNYFAFWLRFDGDIPPYYFALFKETVLLVLLTRALVFIPFRLYEGLWRYTSLWDLRNIIAAVLSSSTIIYGVILSSVGITGARYPRSILFVDTLLLLCFMTGIRLVRRACRDL